MDKITVTPATIKQLLQNAENYALEMAATATPEQIEMVNRQNDLFDRGVELCSKCNRESKRVLETCEFCGKDKMPF